MNEGEYRDELARTMTEEQLQRSVLSCAGFLGWRCYHTHDSRRSQAGFPDLVLVHVQQRRVVYAELKREKGRVRGEQQAWLDDLAAVDAEVYLWRPADWHHGRIEEILRGDDERDCDG